MEFRRAWRIALVSAPLLAAETLIAQAPQPGSAVARALAEIEAAEASRIRGDSAAWKLVSPAFLFGHSTGGVDDRAAFLEWRSSRPAGARARRFRDASPPVARLDGDVLVRVRVLADSAPAEVRPGQSQVLDVYVRREGVWHWLAHQTSEVRPRWAPVALDSAAADEYAGTYAAADGTQRRYARREGGLVQLTGGGERPLVPLSAATFGYEGLSATVTFTRDRSGRVVAAEESSRVGFTRFAREDP